MGFIFLMILNIKGIGNEDFTVYYPEGYKREAILALSYLEKYKRHVESITGNMPRRLIVMIEDIGVVSNGFADPLAPSIHLFTAVPNPFPRFGTTRSWWRTVSVHEYTHIAHLTNVGGIPNLLRFLLGKWIIPNMLFSPLYMIEGVTVFTESSLVPYEGRLNEGYYDAYKNLLAKKRKIPSVSYLTHLPYNYPGYTLGYLLGGEFTEYLSQDKALKSKGERLREYYTLYGSTFFTLTGIDFPAIKVWKKRKRSLYYEWKRKEEEHASYTEIQGEEIAKGYRLNFLAKNQEGIYYYKTILLPFSFDYLLSYGEVLFYDFQKRIKKRVLRGDVVLPLKTDGKDLYIGVLELKKGGKNVSLYGLRYVVSLYRIRNQKKERIIQDEIKSFAVYKGKIFYSKKEKEGSIVYILDNKKINIYYVFDSLLVQDMVFDKDGNMIFIGYKEGDGNNLYMLTKNKKLQSLTDVDFSFSGLFLNGKSLYFSANYKGMWKSYRYDLKNKKLYLIHTDDFAYYPVRVGNSVYYITLAPDGEVLKKTEYKEKEIEWNEKRRRISPPLRITYVKKGLKEEFHTLLWPDFMLPYWTPKVSGFIAVGHDALEINRYELYLKMDTTFSYNFIYGFSGIPYTQIDIRLNSDRSSTLLQATHIIFAKNTGLIRENDILFGVYPFSKEVVSLTGVYIKPDERISAKLYAGGRVFIPDSRNYGIEAGGSLYFPLGFLVFVPRLEGVYSPGGIEIFLTSHDTLKGTYGIKSHARFTLPLLELNRGVDFPHLFFERFYLSFDLITARTDKEANYNLLAYLTTDMSILSGFLRFSLSAGAGYDPKTGFFPIGGFGAELIRLKRRVDFTDGIGKRLDNRKYRFLLKERIEEFRGVNSRRCL